MDLHVGRGAKLLLGGERGRWLGQRFMSHRRGVRARTTARGCLGGRGNGRIPLGVNHQIGQLVGTIRGSWVSVRHWEVVLPFLLIGLDLALEYDGTIWFVHQDLNLFLHGLDLFLLRAHNLL